MTEQQQILNQIEILKQELKKYPKEKKKVQSFMLHPSVKTELTEHFKSLGYGWGEGIRMVLSKYMENIHIDKE